MRLVEEAFEPQLGNNKREIRNTFSFYYKYREFWQLLLVAIYIWNLKKQQTIEISYLSLRGNML